MFTRILQWLPAVVVVLTIATASADSGFLPHAGPLPLRFRAPPPPAVEHAKPAVIAPVPATIALPAPTMPSAPPETNNVTIKLAATTNAPAIEFVARDPDTTTPAVPVADKVISPQMLIQYFTTSTNAGVAPAGPGPRAPISFTPPPVTAPVTPPVKTPPSASP